MHDLPEFEILQSDAVYTVDVVPRAIQNSTALSEVPVPTEYVPVATVPTEQQLVVPK